DLRVRSLERRASRAHGFSAQLDAIEALAFPVPESPHVRDPGRCAVTTARLHDPGAHTDLGVDSENGRAQAVNRFDERVESRTLPALVGRPGVASSPGKTRAAVLCVGAGGK